MSPRNIKFILRTGILVLAALTLALAVRLVLENKEITKLLPATQIRTMLLIIAPLTSLALLHFTLAVRSFAARSLGIELAMLLGSAALFFALLAPRLIGTWILMPVDECGRLLRACPHELMWAPTWWVQSASIAVSVVLIVGAVAYAVSRQ